MFFSSELKSPDIANTVRNTDVTVECAKLLREECKTFDFGLDNSYCDGDDVSISYESFKRKRPAEWEKFFNILIDQKDKSKIKQRICDSVFQILYKMIHNNGRRTPLAISFAQAIQDICRSRHLTNLGCKLGFSVSYDEIERIDTDMVQRIIDQAGEFRVPVPPSIDPKMVINAATDNFDQNDGKCGSHDTILMLFQNALPNETDRVSLTISTRMSDRKRFRKLPEILSCQTLIKAQRDQLRETIPDKFTSANLTEISMEDTISDYSLWSLIRYRANEDSDELIKGIPSFSAINSLFNDTTVTPTNIAFTRILPYPATDYDSIYTTTINFQDVLRQKEQSSGALWCDEGVYRIAKELQLLNSHVFDNIFIGLGGFHTEKIILACCGLYLKEIGVRDVFVYNEIYGPGVTDGTIMKGEDYILCREAMRNLAEF